MKVFRPILLLGFLLTNVSFLFAQSPNGLLFREHWKEIPAALPVTQEHVSHSGLVLTLHGPARHQVKKSNHPEIPNDPFYIWSGECEDTWAVSLALRNKWMDLTGDKAVIRFMSRQSGFRELRIVVKLADGTWLVSEQSAGHTKGWVQCDWLVSQLQWRRFDIDKIVEGPPVESADLSNVAEIGFTDLMRGGGTPASSRLDWIEVHGKALDAVR